MTKKLLFCLTLLLSQNCFANTDAVVFPNANDALNKEKCVEITINCTFDQGQMCKKKYCGVNLKQNELDNFARDHQLIGKRFPSLFDMETYIKKTLPPELSGMTIAFAYRKGSAGTNNRNYNPNRINVVLDSKDYITKLVIE